jgi:Putative Flp pilus-assembly TadE/G-like
MRKLTNARRRRGAIIPLLTVSLIGLLAFVALAIDVGMLAVARTQCQNAADIASLAGARMLDGKSANNNLPAAIAKAYDTAEANSVLNQNITAPQVTAVTPGVYRYDPTAQRFQGVFTSPGPSEAYTVMQVSVMTDQPTYFGKLLGINSLNIGAIATAVHRPRDVAIVLDFSLSMQFSSEMNPLNSPVMALNPDDRFPRFGPWSIYNGANMVMTYPPTGAAPSNLTTWTPPTPMQRVWQYVDTGGETHAANNHTVATYNGPPIVGDFLLNDNVTNAFVRSGPFPNFPNIRANPNGYPNSLATPAPPEFSNQSSLNFTGDPFPLRVTAVIVGTNPPTPDQYAQTTADYLDGRSLLGITRATVTNTTYDSTFETNGYDYDFPGRVIKSPAQRFQGFTMGPGYYGKTFYYWPPDSRTPVAQMGDNTYVPGDWRRRFFTAAGGTAFTATTTPSPGDNSVLWSGAGAWQNQYNGGNPRYLVNYDAILAWLKKGPQVLPSSLRSGRVVYYDAIPDTIPVNANGTVQASATADQRFWKDYIDYVLGAGRFAANNTLYGVNSANTNPGVSSGEGGASTTTLNYNSPSTTALAPRITSRATLVAASAANGNSPIPYMRYDDSPIHPRLQFWFGPLTMLGYMMEPGNWKPGTCHEAHCWHLKAGINSAIADIQTNHPNDLAALIYFSGLTQFNTARVSMGKNYTKMQNALWFPYPLLDNLSDVTQTVRPYSTGGSSTGNPAGLSDAAPGVIPNANGSTCPEMGFKVAFNELSSATGGGVTYNGRRGAQKMVIFETDGVPNTTTNGTLTATGAGTAGLWYYAGVSSSNFISNSTTLAAAPKQNARDVVRQTVAMDTANPPGYSTVRAPARVHSLAFGEMFEPTTISTMKPAALRFLAAVQIDGNTSPWPPGWTRGIRNDDDGLDYNTYFINIEPWKVITGNYSQRIDKIRQAMERIMDSGVSVALIQ